MKIVLIGAGNLATNLGKGLLQAGHEIAQVFSRTMESAGALADILGSKPITDLAQVCTDADIYILSVKDTVLEDLQRNLLKGREHALMVHTAGSMKMDVLEADRRGVFYPLQTFSKGKEVDFKEIPFFLEANHEEDLAVMRELAETLTDKIYVLSSNDRKWLHVAAVFGCNFVNHCYSMAANLLEKHDIPFSVMLPLIAETAEKVKEIHPKDAQTGPAMRWDTNVMDRHLGLLNDQPDLQEIYRLFSEHIHKAQ